MKKKIQYIWYYYKIHIIVAISIIALVIYSFANQGPISEYDHSIAIISEKNYPSQEKVDELIKLYESKYEGTFEVRIYNVKVDGFRQDEVTISKLGVDISNNISEYYFIEDLDGFMIATNNLEFKTIEKVENIDWLKGYDLDSFYYCVR